MCGRHWYTLANSLLIVCAFQILRTVRGQCSGSTKTLTATQEKQYFTSDGYNNGAGSYSSNLDCSWEIYSSSSSYRLIVYVENYDTTCSGDVINIYDGNATSSTALASNLCGTGQSSALVSSGAYVLFNFTTDGTAQSVGFKAVYFFAKDLSGTGCTADQTLTPTSTPGYITSPSFPELYDVNADCRWILTVSEGTVEVEIIWSDIESSTNCAFDRLEVYDGDYVCENTKIAAICSRYPGGIATTYYSNGTSFLLKFASDGSLSFRGFLLSYTKKDLVINDQVSSVSEDRFMLGIGIGCGCGATAALLAVAILILIKKKCRSPKLVSPRVTVSVNGAPHGVRTPSITGSMYSSESRNGFIPNGHRPESRFGYVNDTSSSNSSAKITNKKTKLKKENRNGFAPRQRSTPSLKSNNNKRDPGS